MGRKSSSLIHKGIVLSRAKTDALANHMIIIIVGFADIYSFDQELALCNQVYDLETYSCMT